MWIVQRDHRIIREQYLSSNTVSVSASESWAEEAQLLAAVAFMGELTFQCIQSRDRFFTVLTYWRKKIYRLTATTGHTTCSI